MRVASGVVLAVLRPCKDNQHFMRSTQQYVEEESNEAFIFY